MADRDDLEALFLAHRQVIGHLAASVGRRQGLRGDDLDDFVAWVNVRFIENGYALLAKVRDAGATPGYVATVVANLGHEYRIRRWGRWRPSAAARRLGPVAVRLEQLVYRDGMRLAEAAQLLRTAGLTALSDGALAAMLAACPMGAPSRPSRSADLAPDGAVDALPDDDGRADARVLDEEAEDERRSLGARLAAAVAALPAEEQVMVRLRYWKGLSVADVARALGVPQKPLYRRLERVLAGLRSALERDGVDREAIQALLGEPRPPDADDRDDPDGPALPVSPPPQPPRPPPAGARLGDVRPPPDGDFGRAQPSL